VKSGVPVLKLGDLLVELQLLTREQLGVALQFQEANEKKHPEFSATIEKPAGEGIKELVDKILSSSKDK